MVLPGTWRGHGPSSGRRMRANALNLPPGRARTAMPCQQALDRRESPARTGAAFPSIAAAVLSGCTRCPGFRILLLTSGAMEIRTPDLLHAIWRQDVHPRPSPQVTSSTYPDALPQEGLLMPLRHQSPRSGRARSTPLNRRAPRSLTSLIWMSGRTTKPLAMAPPAGARDFVPWHAEASRWQADDALGWSV